MRRVAALLSREPGARILDLGCGTGSTFRALSPQAPEARWTLVDHDPLLLQAARSTLPDGVLLRQADLREIEEMAFEGAGLVTASALLDLVSQDWLSQLVERLSREDAAVYAALNFDGSVAWSHPHPADGAVVAAFNAHQKGDKGFGPALGRDAAVPLAVLLREAGFEVWTAPSPWTIEASGALHRAFVEGMLQALGEAGVAIDGVEDWERCRRAAAAGSCRVGHIDLFPRRTR